MRRRGNGDANDGQRRDRPERGRGSRRHHRPARRRQRRAAGTASSTSRACPARTSARRNLSINVATVPPGAIAYAHIHDGFEVMLYIVQGRVKHTFGEGLTRGGHQRGRRFHLHQAGRAARGVQHRRRAADRLRGALDRRRVGQDHQLSIEVPAEGAGIGVRDRAGRGWRLKPRLAGLRPRNLPAQAAQTRRSGERDLDLSPVRSPHRRAARRVSAPRPRLQPPAPCRIL